MLFKTEFREYLDKIKAQAAVQERVEYFFEELNKIIDEEIQSIFVTDVVKEDGVTEFTSLWLFSDRHFTEVKQFLFENAEERFDFSVLKKQVTYWEIVKQDYDLLNAQKSSRMAIYVKLTYGLAALFQASGPNCGYLTKILKKHIQPNIREN